MVIDSSCNLEVLSAHSAITNKLYFVNYWTLVSDFQTLIAIKVNLAAIIQMFNGKVIKCSAMGAITYIPPILLIQLIRQNNKEKSANVQSEHSSVARNKTNRKSKFYTFMYELYIPTF